MGLFKKGAANRDNSKGFTLLEVLITVSVIAVLSFILVVVVNPSEILKKSRDTQRISDLNSIKSALDAYLAHVTLVDLEGAVNNLCLAPTNGEARIAYSYSGSLSACADIVATGIDATINTGFSNGDYCYNVSETGTTYDLVDDFDPLNNPSSVGSWKYGHLDNTLANFIEYITTSTLACDSGGPLDQWYDNEYLITSKNTTSTSCVIPGIGSLAPGAVMMSPGDKDEYNSSRWTVPTPGQYIIAGQFYSVSPVSTANVRILQNGVEIFASDLNGNSVPFNLPVTLEIADQIDFAVGAGTFFEATDVIGIDATITDTAAPVNLARAIDGTGWIPVDFASIPGGSPMSSIPVDPINTIVNSHAPSYNDFTYRYACQGNTSDAASANVYELNAVLESDALTVVDNKMAKDGGDNDLYYEVGSNLRLIGAGNNF